MGRFELLRVVGLLLVGSAHGAKFFTNATVPANLTASCATALLADVNCSPVKPAMRSDEYYSNTTLTKACTTDCAASLNTWRNNIRTACGNQTWIGYDDSPMPVSTIPDLIRYHHDIVCLQDNGRWCNIVAAQAAQNVTGISKCDLCFIKSLRLQAGSPYYDGPALASQSVYENKTSSCKVTGYPLSTATNPYFTPTTDVVTATPCAGRTYAIKTTDDCHIISKSQNISTGWLMTDNNLAAYCSNFPKTGNLCLVNTCSVYTVKTNDTCASIAKANNITEVQLKAWNPIISTACYNIRKMNGTEVCKSQPGKAYVEPSGGVYAPSTATTPAPVPTNVATGTNRRCGRFYSVSSGEYCNLITIKFHISSEDFIFLNPELNANCTNLYADQSYCVQAVGDINTYSGRSGYITVGPTGTGPKTPYSNFPKATWTAPTTTRSILPLASGTRDDCQFYFNGNSVQANLTNSLYKSQCELAAAVYNVPVNDFLLWNSGLGNVSASCNLQKGVKYCGQLYFGQRPLPTLSSASQLPIRPGYNSNCTQFGDVPSDWKCTDVLDQYALTIAQFYAYNPAVKNDCTGLWTSYQYCIRTPDYKPSVTTTTTTVKPTTTATKPRQTGQPANCIKWYAAVSGDTCTSIENAAFITDAQFHAWNPAISADCSSGLWANYEYCIGTTDSATVTRVTTTATATASGVPAPSPNQPGNAVSNCNKYAMAQDGDTCQIFAQRAGITPPNLFRWNSVLKSDGSGCSSSFWKGYYYCVGVAT